MGVTKLTIESITPFTVFNICGRELTNTPVSINEPNPRILSKILPPVDAIVFPTSPKP